jgi:hypothetical protein
MSILPQVIGTTLAVGNSLIGAIGGIQAPGQGAGQFPVFLGGVQLQGFEVPESAPWGGEQALTLHKLIGGARVIDAMGVDDRAITLKGTFLSPDADSRALQVDVMRKAGQPVMFGYANHVYQAVIKSFAPDFERPDRVKYQLTLEILQDVTQPLAAGAPSIDDQFGFGLGNIGTALAGLSGGAGPMPFATAAAALSTVNAAVIAASGFGPAAAQGVPSAVQGARRAVGAMIGAVAGGIGGPVMSAINGALAVAGSLTASSAANLGAMSAAIGQGQAIIAPAMAYADFYLTALPTFGGVVSGAPGAIGAAALRTSTIVAGALPQMQQIGANLGTMQQNINATPD